MRGCEACDSSQAGMKQGGRERRPKCAGLCRKRGQMMGGETRFSWLQVMFTWLQTPSP